MDNTQAKTPWPLVLLLIGAGVVASFQVGKAPPVLDTMRRELGMSLFLAGWILSTFNIIGLALGSASGASADALGHRRLLLAGLCLQGAGSVSGALTHSVAILFLTRIVEGLGFLMVAVTAPALIVRITKPRDLRLALSGWSCFLPAGAAIIMLITPLVTASFGWRGLWLFNALFVGGYALVTAACTQGLVHPKPSRRVTLLTVLRDMLTTSTAPGPFLLALIFSTYTLQWMAMMGFLPTLLVETYRMSSGQASVLTALVVAMNVPGNLAGGWLMSRRAGRRHLIVSAGLVMGLCSLAIYGEGFSFWVRFWGCLLFSGAGGLLPAAVISGAPVHAPRPDLVATTNGLIMQGSQLGQMVGPPALALVVSGFGGWEAAPWLLCTSAAFGIALSAVLALLERKTLST